MEGFLGVDAFYGSDSRNGERTWEVAIMNDTDYDQKE
jgi:hypothetical protein